VLERDTRVSGQRLHYGLHLARLPNLIYQLDCIAGAIVCGRPLYRDLWTSTLGLSNDDEAALARWKTLRARYGGELKRLDQSLPALPLLLPSGAADLGERQRIASLASRTPAAYQSAIALLSSDSDARQLRTLMERFAPRFDGWWQTRGFAAGTASFDGYARLLADPFLDAFLERAAHFYQAELPDGPALEVYVIVQPKSSRQFVAAYQLEGYAAVEAPTDRDPAENIEVVAHELFHYFSSRMQADANAALLRRVCAADDPLAVASFGVLDEAVAAALGNGLVARHYLPPEAFAKRLARDQGLDNYRAASLIARALLPSLAGILERGVTASADEFLTVYLAAARVMYEGPKPRPFDYLHSHVSVADARFASATQRLQEATNAGYPYLREYSAWDAEAQAFIVQHPFQSAALFLDSADQLGGALATLGATKGQLAAARAAATRARGVVYAFKRTPKSYAFFFVASEPNAMVELVNRFIAAPAAENELLVELP
jgi:hypothetical protein